MERLRVCLFWEKCAVYSELKVLKRHLTNVVFNSTKTLANNDALTTCFVLFEMCRLRSMT